MYKSDIEEATHLLSSHHPQEVLLAQFILYVHNGGLKPDSFHFLLTDIYLRNTWNCRLMENVPMIHLSFVTL